VSGERIFEIEGGNPVEFFGVNNANMKLVEEAFPHLRIVVRGLEIKVAGTDEQLEGIAAIIDYLKKVYDRFGVVKASDVKQILNSTEEENRNYVESEEDNKVLVHGRNGRLIRARTKNQKRMVESVQKNDMLFAIGPAGTGKTYTAVALAVRALKNKEVRRIILTRPAVEAGESLGFLPGDMRDKLDPYLQPLYDALRDMLPQGKLISYFEDGTIEIAPLAFMRGRTLDHAFVILDEAQNTTSSQLKMFLTRMGKDAKFVITGDITQVDLPKNQHSGLLKAEKLLGGIKGIDFIKLDQNDVVRHKLVTRIIKAYSEE
jgi:phosphate starvation-inducible PhoH-like protein